MDLLLWRHADAEYTSPDEERALSGKGRHQAEKMGRWLRRHAPDPLCVLVSPARRARETVQAFRADATPCAALGTQAGPGDLLAAAGWPDAQGAVLLVGHEPTLGEVAARLLGAPAPLPIRKGALWWFSRQDGETRLRAAISPADLD